MTPLAIKPSPRLRSKYRLLSCLMLLLQLLWSIPLGLLIGWDEQGTQGALVGVGVMLALNALWFLPTLWLVDRYYESISYGLDADEILVRVGILTQTVKHVPFRTVTNIAIKRDIFDRYLFNIGTVEVQTAGANSTQGSAEETLSGLVDYEGIYTSIAEALRRYRTLPMAPTQGEAEGSAPADLAALLVEARAIRALLSERRAQG